MTDERFCCYSDDDKVGCTKDPEFEIYPSGDDPYSGFDVCAEHLSCFCSYEPYEREVFCLNIPSDGEGK